MGRRPRAIQLLRAHLGGAGAAQGLAPERALPIAADRDWWDDETFLALMRIRGMECRSRYAEAFQASKAVLSLGAGVNTGND